MKLESDFFQVIPEIGVGFGYHLRIFDAEQPFEDSQRCKSHCDPMIVIGIDRFNFNLNLLQISIQNTKHFELKTRRFVF